MQALFNPATARQRQEMARGIARKPYRSHFGHPAGFDLIASEMAHDGR